jgi:hypothetical protein
MADDKTTTSPAPAAQNEQRTATIRYIDRPEIGEVFADSVTGLLYDGQTLRMEFAVTRCADQRPPLSGVPPGAVAGSRDRAHQSHAAGRDRAHPIRRRQARVAAGHVSVFLSGAALFIEATLFIETIWPPI